ncbi:hypothetical protein J5N97_024810 [Dioscorea zingiberensis]|uniref:Uncharacterized protein n=1 Tax=Dioscorea zingiberensis TaxID=325984 RepID=A0A9D5H9E6_9LILI|nr:hypothetical protein J5N97_024810 [Dioscorea zingiberensis]
MSVIKRECHELLRSTTSNMKCHRMVEVEAVAEHVGEEMTTNGVIRMKVLMTRHQLRQVLKGGGGVGVSGDGGAQPTCAVTAALERRLHGMRRRHVKRVDCSKGRLRRRTWRPALQSIPEDSDHIDQLIKWKLKVCMFWFGSLAFDHIDEFGFLCIETFG